MSHPFLSSDSEKIWLERSRVSTAEKKFVETQYGTNNNAGVAQGESSSPSASALIKEIEYARQQIQKSLKSDSVSVGSDGGAVVARLNHLESENERLSGFVDDLRLVVKNLENRIIALESSSSGNNKAAVKPAQVNNKIVENGVEDSDDDDDDIDLFGSDDEADAAAEKLKQERIKAYADKKAKKPALIAKSNIILDVKPWDDETDMNVLEGEVRKITMDGLLWGASKLVAVGYGIKKLQISCVVEDDKVSTDDLEDQIVALEDYVQSMDIAAFNKV